MVRLPNQGLSRGPEGSPIRLRSAFASVSLPSDMLFTSLVIVSGLKTRRLEATPKLMRSVLVRDEKGIRCAAERYRREAINTEIREYVRVAVPVIRMSPRASRWDITLLMSTARA
jgi:hypothetical protein